MKPCHDPALSAMLGALYDALRCRTRPRIRFSRVRIGNVSVSGDIAMFIQPVDKTSQLGPLAITDSFGNAAPVDGVPVWSLSDPTNQVLTAATDGMSATLVSTDGVLRTVQVDVAADADLGAGVVTIHGLLEVQYVAGGASIIAIPAALVP